MHSFLVSLSDCSPPLLLPLHRLKGLYSMPFRAIYVIYVKCPRIVYTDLNGLWPLAGFGDEGRRVPASCRCRLGEVLRARAREIGDQQAALSSRAEVVDDQALVRPPGGSVGPADRAVPGQTSGA